MPAGERLVVRVALERVDPDDRVRLPREPRHLRADERRVLALPAVRDDDHDRAARQRPPAPLVVERLQRRADPRAARPVDDALRRLARARAPGRGLADRASGASGACRRRTPRRRARSRTSACRKSTSAREYASIEPDTSQMTTSLRGTWMRSRKARSTASPPVASEARTSRRMSSCRPRRSRRSRRERRLRAGGGELGHQLRRRARTPRVDSVAKSFSRRSSSGL